MHWIPRLVRPLHTLGELGRSQFRVLGVALAVDKAEQCRIRGEIHGEMLALAFGRGSRGPTKRPVHVWRSRPTDLLTDISRGMPEMLEVSWVDFCRAQASEPCVMCGRWTEANESAESVRKITPAACLRRESPGAASG